MARQLFIDQNVETDIRENLFSHSWLEADNKSFVQASHKAISYQVESVLQDSFSADVLERLFYQGSFARSEACPDSDVDLIFLADEVEAQNMSQILRKHFRKYSVKHLNQERKISFESPFEVISAHWTKPVFDSKHKITDYFSKIKESDLSEVFEAIKIDRKNRAIRFGQFPGKLGYNIKNSRGGLKDTLQALWVCDAFKQKEAQPALFKQREFLLKLRSINHLLGFYDTLNLSAAKEYLKFFKYDSDKDFFKAFFSFTEQSHLFSLGVFNTQNEEVSYAKTLNLKEISQQRGEISRHVPEFNRVKGLVQSASYHTWTVDEHLIQCVSHMNEIIKEEKENFQLTEFEEDVLRWAAFLHDIKKGLDQPHSSAGAEYVHWFGGENNWLSEKTELVSWLVKEHLTLSRFAFKDDPYQDEAIHKLYLKGVEKRKAVLLCLLTEADIKATNLSSWSVWKKNMLRSLLDRVLKKESLHKEKIYNSIQNANKTARELVRSLTSSEILSIPFEILVKDLNELNESDELAFYDYDERIWIRLYKKEDQKSLALNFISRIFSAGGFVHHAFFKTLQDGRVYNWLCIEAGVLSQAFKKRYFAVRETRATQKMKFSRIRKHMINDTQAVISFKGKDREGMLLVAIDILDQLDLDIRWGHAVTWGDEIEDVFGVFLRSKPDWSILDDFVSN